MDMSNKVMEIFGNEQFKAAVANVTTPEDMQKLIAEYGLELTVDEVIELCGQIVKAMNSGDEIGEDELDNVAGGVVVILGVTFTTAQLIWLGIGSAGAAALGIWNGYHQNRK